MVIVGGGLGGLQAALHLRGAPVEVTLVDRRNFHLFQPLTYQVATGALSPGEVAYPLRVMFKRHPNVRVVMAEVVDFDLGAREVLIEAVGDKSAPRSLPYDELIVAGGSHYSYFGHDHWRPVALPVKSLESALAVRRRILSAFEAAEIEPNPDRRSAWLTFVIVGAGPTGVEMAGPSFRPRCPLRPCGCGRSARWSTRGSPAAASSWSRRGPGISSTAIVPIS